MTKREACEQAAKILQRAWLPTAAPTVTIDARSPAASGRYKAFVTKTAVVVDLEIDANLLMEIMDQLAWDASDDAEMIDEDELARMFRDQHEDEEADRRQSEVVT